jgi:hypothetical protein
MRFLLGIIVGILLTIIVTYIVDADADGTQSADGSPERTMVNWDVVGERLGELTVGARRVWADFTREITGPP